MKTQSQWLFEAPPLFEATYDYTPAVKLEFEDERSRFEGEWETGVNRRSRDYIRWVQQSLNRVMGARLTVDGVMGAQTRRAIAAFQKRARLTADGIVGTRTEKALIAAGASPPSPVRPPSPPNTQPPIPQLFTTESTPQSATLYVKIPLGQGIQPATGIFIPGNYRPQSSVDLILYLHGHLSPSSRSSYATIQQYWRKPTFVFREKVNTSGKNVILVAPTLGPKSQAGSLLKPGGLDAYLNQVLAALAAYGPHQKLKQIPTLGNLILACHSGGGYPMRQIALSQTAYASNIKECWGFDCTYNTGDDTQWAQWAKTNSSARLFIYYIPQRCCRTLKVCTASKATNLRTLAQRQNLLNVSVREFPTCGHNQVPIAHWETRIKAAPFAIANP